MSFFFGLAITLIVVFGSSIYLYFYLSNNIKREQQNLDLRTDAYHAYLLSILKNQPPEKRTEHKATMFLYSNSSVLTALKEFETGGTALDSEENKNRFLRLIDFMRMDARGEFGYQSGTIRDLLNEPTRQSPQ